ncbi:MAG: C25 family cysteine peptidase, partial [Desulfobacterales bacterium]|nr:C25 family cysteine peptidase [Desulfobacterales bacterium]
EGSLAEAAAAGILKDDLTFGTVLLAMLEQAKYPFEEEILEGDRIQELDPQGSSFDYVVDFSVSSNGSPTTAVVTLQLPEKFLPDYRPNSSGNTNLPPFDGDPHAVLLGTSGTFVSAVEGATAIGATLTVELADITPGESYRLAMRTRPGIQLGDFDASAQVVLASDPANPGSDDATIAVDQNFEDGTTPSVGTSELVLSHIGVPNDSDPFILSLNPDTLPGNTRISIFLKNPGDQDVAFYRPLQDEGVSAAIDTADRPLSSLPLTDPGRDAIDTVQNPSVLSDSQLLNLPGKAVGGISANPVDADDELEVISDPTDLETTQPYTIAVSSYNGNFSEDPFVLRVRSSLPPEIPSCAFDNLGSALAARFPQSGNHGVASTTLKPTPPASPTAVALFNYERWAMSYGVEAANSVEQALLDLAADPGLPVDLEIVWVDDSGSVRDAADEWDKEPCSAEKANDYVGAVSAIVEGYTGIEYVLIVGGDEILPFARKADLLSDANQSVIAGAFPVGSALNGSFATEHILTDDVYGDRDPVPWLNDELFVPEIGVGRLVEAPVEVIGLINNSMANNATLDPATALSTGYDFLTDGANAVTGPLGAAIAPGVVNDGLIRDDWTTAELASQIAGTTIPDILSLNAHFGPNELIAPDLLSEFTTQDFSPIGSTSPDYTDHVIFSVGCNAAIPIADNLFTTTTPGGAAEVDWSKALDWSQVFAQAGAGAWMGNTGFGIGHKNTVGLTELINVYFAENLAAGMTTGEANWYAKQRYFAQLGVYGPYDYKVLMETVLYGMPWHRLGEVVPDPVGEQAAAATQSAAAGEASSAPLAPVD